ncbi:MAG: tyrosine-type recombinase/integrase [Mycobacteriales bacterium]
MTGPRTLTSQPTLVAGRGGDRHLPGPPDLSELLAQFPPRPRPATWQATEASRGQVLARLLAPPFTFEHAEYQASVRGGVRAVLDWLGSMPGRTWQDRWVASGAEFAADWRSLLNAPTAAAGRRAGSRPKKVKLAPPGLKLLVCADVIRPSLDWLLETQTPRHLAGTMAQTRDPAAFTRLHAACEAAAIGRATRDVALARIAMMMAAKGGSVADVTVGDCVECQQASVAVARRSGRNSTFRSPFFYQLLRSLGGFPNSAPALTRAFIVSGQLSVEEMIDRYGIECQPVRDLLVDYLREFLVPADYSTVDQLSYVLGKLFWRDLEHHHPGVDSLRLPAEVAAAWKQRIRTKTTRAMTPSGEVTETRTPRIAAISHLATVRAFYLDIAQWAAEDPSRWGPWVTVCPIRDGELDFGKDATRRKSRMDQRTRERLPVLPALAAVAAAERCAAVELLAAARTTQPGATFTVGGVTLMRPPPATRGTTRLWGVDPATGKYRDLEAEERRAFWAWAVIEVLRQTGVRIEELTELSHHSLIQYQLPATGELVPLLQIAPSKTDTERLLVISPELADVLATIVHRVRGADGSIPLVVAYDHDQRVFNSPMPLLFQWRFGLEHRQLVPHTIRGFLNKTLASTGLTDAAGAPLRFTPHDFRRLFLTDAIMHGMPPHIAALIAGHSDINTTLGYKAVYPEEVINGHRAFIALRRANRPAEEYRTPTEEEWEEFCGHFARRRVALGECGRSYSTPCIHEHSCLRCPLLRPSPAQRPRIEEISANLAERIAEAEREGWTGEVEGLKVSLAGAGHKLAQLDELARRAATVHLGMPTFPQVAGRTVPTVEREASR